PLVAAAGSLPAAAARIVEAATDLFAERGYYGTSMRELAEIAGTRASTIYHYFPTKADVLGAVMRRTMTTLIAEVQGAGAAHTDPPARLAAMVRAHVEFNAANQAAAFVAGAEVRSLTGAHREAVLRLRSEYEEMFASVLRTGIAGGEFELEDVETVTFGLIRMCSGVAAWYSEDGPQAIETIADQYVDLALAAVGRKGA
ncbi:MAG: TetR/AcrR family transcriptional regulator, partial [Solirubrobacterales bacterium]